MYRWYVEYVLDEQEVVIESRESWDARWKAENNLDARMRAHPPDIPGLPRTAFMIDTGITEVWQ